MTYHSDPTRWTQSPDGAPELLRGGLEAASQEGPSDLQMRTLALKLAAIGTGAAVAVGAAGGAKASTTAAGAGMAAASGGTFSLAKIAVSIALIGAAATGGSLLLMRPTSPAQPKLQANLTAPVAYEGAPVVHEPVELAPAPRAEAAVKAPVTAPVAAPVTAPVEATVEAPVTAPVVATLTVPVTAKAEQAAVVLPEPVVAAAAPTPRVEDTQAEFTRAERRERRHARASSVEPQQAVAPAVTSRGVPSIEQVAGQKPEPSEIELLSKARAALAAQPRDAYRLTEEHKAIYPEGMFGQERDALAVEALQRAGDLKHARELAEVFVKRYPSSPHAHRFRETMSLP
jgi:hypothetical protein